MVPAKGCKMLEDEKNIFPPNVERVHMIPFQKKFGLYLFWHIIVSVLILTVSVCGLFSAFSVLPYCYTISWMYLIYGGWCVYSWYKERVYPLHEANCVNCQYCMNICPTHAITVRPLPIKEDSTWSKNIYDEI